MESKTKIISRRELAKKFTGALFMAPIFLSFKPSTASAGRSFVQGSQGAGFGNLSNGIPSKISQKNILVLTELGGQDITVSNFLAAHLPTHNFLRDFFYVGNRAHISNGTPKYDFISKQGRITFQKSDVLRQSNEQELQKRIDLMKSHKGDRFLVSAFAHQLKPSVVALLKEMNFTIIRVTNGAQTDLALRNYFFSAASDDWAGPGVDSDRKLTSSSLQGLKIDHQYVQESQELFHSLSKTLTADFDLKVEPALFEKRIEAISSQLGFGKLSADTRHPIWGNTVFHS